MQKKNTDIDININIVLKVSKEALIRVLKQEFLKTKYKSTCNI